MTIAQVASRAYWSLADEQPDGEPGLEALYYYSNPLAKRPDDKKSVRVQLGFASAAHVAVVDSRPGNFRNQNLALCRDSRLRVANQSRYRGGPSPWRAAHGIAAALFEEFIYDENGQLLTTSFMDYLNQQPRISPI